MTRDWCTYSIQDANAMQQNEQEEDGGGWGGKATKQVQKQGGQILPAR